ncbi:hypothetical protein [Streptomyces sp. NBC_00989]|uniref:hypothetical protein n=1 Tax=Streptomyces sp. NBC_00989 TaxID=2903705 RepID=UPI003863F971|nr:hypothetical protein OG714_50035 [Streptomyces sp. NBC_00989]
MSPNLTGTPAYRAPGQSVPPPNQNARSAAALLCAATLTMAAWHARDVLVSRWTVDDAERRAELLAWGVDAIIGNDANGVVKSCAERT